MGFECESQQGSVVWKSLTLLLKSLLGGLLVNRPDEFGGG